MATTKTKLKGVGSGNSPASKAQARKNIKNTKEKVTGEDLSAAKQGRKKFREIFGEVLTNEKQTLLATEFVDLVMDKNLTINNRCRIFELILQIMGEDGRLSSSDFKELADHIEIKID